VGDIRDILLILPSKGTDIKWYQDFISSEVRKCGKQIKIKPAKSCIVQYFKDDVSPKFNHLGGPGGKNGLEYLGLRYDGKKVFLRDSTLSRLYRKASLSSRASAYSYLNKNKGLDIDTLMETYNFSLLFQRFNKVDKTKFHSDDYRTWTFHTYAKRASVIFAEKGSPILKQKRDLKKFIKVRFENALNDYLVNVNK